MIKKRKTGLPPKSNSRVEYYDIPSLEDQLKSIMENFDFEQVLEYMQWNRSRRAYDDNGKCVGTYPWSLMVKGEFKVPNLEELKALARRQLEDVIERTKKDKDNNYYSIHCGPFKSTYRYGILTLECVIESWSYD